MLIVIFSIGLALLIISILVYIKWGDDLYSTDDDWIDISVAVMGLLIMLVSLCAALVLGISYSSRIIIDEKINLYLSENSKIEEQMNTVIENYMGYEQETFEKAKNENAIAVVSMYPELKSNELVSKQIEIYVANNQTIKELECERLKYKLYAWWLFFGKE